MKNDQQTIPTSNSTRRLKLKIKTHGQQSFWSECAFCINIQTLSFSTALADRQLARDSQCVAQLRFASPKFAENLSDWSSLDATAQQFVQLTWAARQLNDLRTLLMEFGGCCEAHWYQFCRFGNNFICFAFRYTFDRSEQNWRVP